MFNLTGVVKQKGVLFKFKTSNSHYLFRKISVETQRLMLFCESHPVKSALQSTHYFDTGKLSAKGQ